MLPRGDGRFRGYPRLGRQALALIVIVGLILVAAGLLTWEEHRRAQQDERQRDQLLLSEAAAAFSAVGNVLETTASAQALVDEEGAVDPMRFQSYASAFVRQPAVRSVSYQPFVAAAGRAGFEADTGIEITEEGRDGELVRASDRDEYFPITFVEPPRSRPLGFDVASDPLRREAIERAQLVNEPTATSPLRLAPDVETGFLVFMPLFVPESPTGRPSNELAGVVSVAFFADEVEVFLLSQLPPGTGMRISHREGVLVEAGEVDPDAPRSEVTLGGRRWTVAVSHPAALSLGQPLSVLGAGALLAAAVAAIGSYLMVQNRRLDVERTRTLGLQAATADLATTPMPEGVRFNAVRHMSSILGGAWTAYLNVETKGKVETLTVSHDEARSRAEQVSPEVVAAALESRRVTRVDIDGDGVTDVLVFPTGGSPERSDALAVFLSHVTPHERDVDLCESLAVLVGSAMRRAEAHQLERHMAETLQRQSLPPSIPDVSGWNIAATYRPALSDAGVGGDFYDIFRPGKGRLVITIGDIVGHGVNAAGSMGQVRMAVRSLAEVLPPHQVLERLDHMASDIPGAAHASIICADIDIDSQEILHSAAGLLPPIVVRRGEADFLWEGRGPIVGVRPGRPRKAAVERLRKGDRLIFYTDGLIENRTRSLDDGLADLASAAMDTSHLDSRRACDEILTALTGDRAFHDDVALVVVDLEG